ncbi:unnamed protein product [Plutella xylostella]|uniref:(diamondback moth) hypothetical protein n=1 Tax=Plutella xylostella TaxID=51655 RepID=A0A8S4EH64_PLUXY|nr:unnamed protein product [Plutella xylostella]
MSDQNDVNSPGSSKQTENKDAGDNNVTSENNADSSKPQKTIQESENIKSVNSAIEEVQTDSIKKSQNSGECSENTLKWVLNKDREFKISWCLPEGSTTPRDFIALCYAGKCYC